MVDIIKTGKDVFSVKGKIFTAEYKKEIIKLVTEAGKKIGDVARDIGVSDTTIRKWIKLNSEHGEVAFPGKGYLRPEDEELRQLRRKVYDLQEENEILKKAMRIFTKPEK